VSYCEGHSCSNSDVVENYWQYSILVKIVIGHATVLSPTAGLSTSPYASHLPHARVGGMSGLLELYVESSEGEAEISQATDLLHLTVDDLLLILDAASILGFVEVIKHCIKLTEIGRDFAIKTILRSKGRLRQQIFEHIPILSSMFQTLKKRQSDSIRAKFLLDLLDEYFPHQEAKSLFATATDLGHYAELFEYDASEARIYLAQPFEAISNQVQ
jgi:NitT/TauT family transport system ATP-binding protein